MLVIFTIVAEDAWIMGRVPNALHAVADCWYEQGDRRVGTYCTDDVVARFNVFTVTVTRRRTSAVQMRNVFEAAAVGGTMSSSAV